MARDISECCVLFNVMDPFSDSVHSGPHWQWAGSSIWWKYTEKKDICLWLCELDCMKTVHGLCVQVIVPCWNAGQCLSRSPVVLRESESVWWKGMNPVFVQLWYNRADALGNVVQNSLSIFTVFFWILQQWHCCYFSICEIDTITKCSISETCA